MVQHKDYCKGPRLVYTAFLHFLATNWIVAGLTSGCTVFVVTAFIILESLYNPVVFDIFYRPTIGIYLALLASWCLCLLAIWRVMPNLLTVGIFVHSCLGHWSLVSVILLWFYGNSAMPMSSITYILYGIIPGYLSIIVTVDLLRSLQTEMLAFLERVESSGGGNSVAVGV